MSNVNKEAAADVAATNAVLSATGGVSSMPKQNIWASSVPARDRIVRFGIAAETLTAIAEITGTSPVCEAIGYLSQWAVASEQYAYCEIIGGVYDGNPEIIATYRKEERGPITYQIGAVWHDDHFGFHS